MSFPIQDNGTAIGKCEFGRRATVLLTYALTEARDTSGNAGPCKVSFVYLLRFFSLDTWLSEALWLLPSVDCN